MAVVPPFTYEDPEDAPRVGAVLTLVGCYPRVVPCVLKGLREQLGQPGKWLDLHAPQSVDPRVHIETHGDKKVEVTTWSKVYPVILKVRWTTEDQLRSLITALEGLWHP